MKIFRLLQISAATLFYEFTDFSLDDEPKYSIEECKERDATYAAPLKIKAKT